MVKMPKLKLTGNYKIRAKLVGELSVQFFQSFFLNFPLKIFKNIYFFVVLDISGDGDFENYVADSRMRMKLFGTKYEKNGKIYGKFDKVNVRIQPGKSKINMKNLFNGEFKNSPNSPLYFPFTHKQRHLYFKNSIKF